jgi:ribonuclease BN (tRNA processing enzyme)
MKITFLGSGTGFAYAKRAAPGILLKFSNPNFNIMLDCGPGNVRQLAKAGLSTNDVGAIMFTHLHPDHTLDLTDFLFCAKYQVVDKNNLSLALNNFVKRYSQRKGHDGFRTKPLLLVGPTGFKDFYRRLLALYGPWIKSSAYRLDIKEVKESEFKMKGINFKTALMLHEKYSVGYRIQAEGKTVVYSGDTAYCNNIVKLGANADLLILECSSSDQVKLPFHLQPHDIARIGKETGAKKIILTHIYEAAEKFDLIKQIKNNWNDMPVGKVKLAFDFMKTKG